MSIKKKLLITFSTTLIVFVLFYSITAEFFIIKGFKELEYESVRQNSALVRRLINLEEENLDKMAYDWASWDQMYLFVEHRNADFLRSNMTPNILRDLNLSFVVITDKNPRVVYYQSAQDTSYYPDRHIPPGNWKPLKKLVRECLQGAHRYGILHLNGKFHFVALRPILRSDDSGPPRGVLVVGREINSEVIGRISEIIGHKVRISHLRSPGEYAGNAAGLSRIIFSDSTCEVSTVLKDLLGNPSIILEMSLPRKITKYGTTSAHLAIMAAFTLGILLGVVLLLQLKRLIFTKVHQLTDEVSRIAQSDDLSERLPEYEEDELGVLVKGFNNLLERAARISEELMLSKNKYKTLFDQSPAGIFVFDNDLKIIECNRSICEMIGTSRQSLLGLDLRMLKHKEVIPHIEAVLKGKQSRYLGLYEATTTDVKLWSSTTLAPLYNQEGEIIGGIGIVEDISEIKKYEWALEESRAHLEAVLESAPGFGVLTTDLDLVITYFNREAGRIFECSSEVARGKRIDEVGGGIANLKDHFVAARESVKEKVVYEFTFEKRKGGKVESFLCHLSGISNKEGELLGYVLFAGNITEKLKAEREKKDLQEQLFHAQKMEAIGRLSGGVAHDFNNLLTGIIGLTQLAIEGVDAESSTYEILQRILTSARRGSKLTKQLLNLSRKHVIKPHTIDLVKVVGNMEDMLRSVIGEDVVLDFRIPGEPVYIQADPSQIEQVIMNLVVNARDAMPQGGKLGVYIEDLPEAGTVGKVEDSGSYGGYVCLVVSDTGCGMDREIQSRIFDPFFTTKPPGRGTGLGLSTVYGTVTQLGGIIEVESAPGSGSKFSVYFPKVACPMEKEEEKEVPLYEKPAAPNTISILVVEDEKAILDIISFVLKREGYNVMSAQNAEEAIRVLDASGNHVDLLIVDLILPGKSGTELAGTLKERFPGIRIIYTSGYTEDILVQKDILEWDAVFLEKPFSPDELLRLCAMVLQREEKSG